MIHSKSFRRYQFVINCILIMVAIIMIAPLVLLFMASISSESSLLKYGYSFIPREFSLGAYRYILSNGQTIARAYGITVAVTFIGTVLHLLIAMMAAFALSIKKLPFRNLISFYIFFTMLFNGGLVPSYLMWTSMFHIKNTIWAYIIPSFLCSAMNIILIRTYYQSSIPEALYEAAKIDGASYLYIFRKIVLPMGKPIMVTIGLFTGLNYWNDWTNGLYYISDSSLLSIQSLLNKMIQDVQALQAHAGSGAGAAIMQVPTVSVRMAIAFVALFPILAVFPFLQKYLEEGIAIGAVKG